MVKSLDAQNVCLPQITSVRNAANEIKGNTKCRMIVYNPDGSIYIKRHVHVMIAWKEMFCGASLNQG